jgi:hypothetical protein
MLKLDPKSPTGWNEQLMTKDERITVVYRALQKLDQPSTVEEILHCVHLMAGTEIPESANAAPSVRIDSLPCLEESRQKTYIN